MVIFLLSYRIRFLSSILIICTALIAYTTNVHAASNTSDAHTSLQAMIDNTLEAINTLQLPDDPKEANILLDKTINKELESIIDFDFIARRIMAKYYKQATDDQKRTFSKANKQQFIFMVNNTLLSTDIKKLSKGLQIILQPTKAKEAKRVRIKGKVRVNGKIISLRFEMYFNSKYKRWLLSNIIAADINLAINLHQQFAVLMDKNKQDIDAVIASWSSAKKVSTTP